MVEQAEAEKIKIRFQPKREHDFATVCKERVDEYFRENHISRHANAAMVFKTLLHFGLLISLYVGILSESFSKPVLLLMCMAMGIIHGLIGVNVGHDALHGAYSSSSRLNKIIGYSYDFVGLSSYVWKISHNFIHHIYTNIPGVDHDIGKEPLLRLSPEDKLYSFHKWQHLYIFPLYCFTGINWIFVSDYAFFFAEMKKRKIPKKDIFAFFFFKVLHVTLFLIIPLVVMTFPWWQILIGFLALQFAGGFTVAVIFQLAHVVDGLEYPQPDAEGLMENQWAEHEMHTTANFATANPFVNYVCGGLNFQIEHHLFPYLCHVHYTAVSPIVRQTAEEFGLPYHENVTFTGAVKSHLRLLKKLGHGQQLVNEQ